ncbi:hypothetical protein DITRI_Ditri16bG0120700 [Diplodiscus trichospermus]
MEVLLMKMPMADAAVKQENNIAQPVGHEEGCTPEAGKITHIGRKLHKSCDLNSPSPCSHGDLVDNKEEDELESAKSQMGEVKEENERLKMMLEEIQENYKSLQLRFFEILQQGAAKKSTGSSAPSGNGDGAPEPELVSLSLGRPPTAGSRKDEKTSSSGKTKEDPEIKAGLSLGLDSKFQLSTETVSNPSPQNSSEEPKEDDNDAGETWQPNKIQKTAKNGDDQEVAQQSQVKRARVSVRTRCDAPTMNDGCQWRKYGQKISKGNPCPKAYYRCTVAQGCPVRKQVQRCVEDMSILITTYEGNHNHPLPISATAMASTTSAAASMLLSGSKTSQQPCLSSTATTTLTNEPNGLNFRLHDSSRTRQLYIPNSTLPLSPTITLDLTASPSSPSNDFNRFSINFPTTAKFPSTNLSFSSSASNILPTVWGSGCLAYGGLPYNQSFSEKNHQAAVASQLSLTETLTKAITSDPSFQSVIAAAISSMVGSCSAKSGDQSNRTLESFGQNLMQAISQNLLTRNGKESSFSSSYFTGLTSSSSQKGSSLQSSLPFSIFSNASTPASDNKERKN